ncbi:hypothetical protein EXIGLDRAFT_721880 [Exidia glandulosa HHB12029]|uniref:F-box domain-containing protein n=1 Tax=Exidia glandulosa HHB12029 TaxID=1314781 RepID=A0A165N7Z6_EXIGL|nr:hypothetical protein EXIGLDRAFT_721880 [Exidia glandulosa HHB12029]
MNTTPAPLAALPLLVLVNVCSYLDPLSLIALTRTCASLHATLRSPERDHVWRTVRLNASPADIGCPDDISQAAWTSLIYERHCHACGGLGLKLLWGVHTRLCASCEQICQEKHTALGGSMHAFRKLFLVAGAFAPRASRARLKEKFLSEIRLANATSAAERQQGSSTTPEALVAELWHNFLAGYHPPQDDDGHFVPSARDIMPAMLEVTETETVFWQIPLLGKSLQLPRMCKAWVYYVEYGLQQLLPYPKTDDRWAATSVWRPIGSDADTSPAWWPDSAHLYLALSEPLPGSTAERRPVGDVLEYDTRAAHIVRGLLHTFEGVIDTPSSRALDAHGAYVQCATCAPPGTERDGLVLHWRHAVLHALTTHRDPPNCQWRRVQPTHAALATARDALSLRRAPVWRCSLCAWSSRLSVPHDDLEAHLRTVHGTDHMHLYAQPHHDPRALAPPARLFDMLDSFASSTIGSSVVRKEEEKPVDPLRDPRGEDAFVFCQRCPVAKRVRHFTVAAAKVHLATEHNLQDYVPGRDYAHLLPSALPSR